MLALFVPTEDEEVLKDLSRQETIAADGQGGDHRGHRPGLYVLYRR